MNMPSTSPASTTEPQAPQRQLVWDAPVRVFHWLTVLSFAGAWLTAESERWRLVHVTLGYTMLGLVAFRIVWGLVGTRHARFASFVRGPRAAWAHLRGMFSGAHDNAAGHNPAGALAIVAMLALTLAAGATGWAHYSDIGGPLMEEAHEVTANGLLLLVGLHLAGVAAVSLLHKRNLVSAMLSGRAVVPPREGIRSAWRSVAVLLLAAVLGFWWLQWQAAPAQPLAAAEHRHGDHD
jgi:cytochrome b